MLAVRSVILGESYLFAFQFNSKAFVTSKNSALLIAGPRQVEERHSHSNIKKKKKNTPMSAKY